MSRDMDRLIKRSEAARFICCAMIILDDAAKHNYVERHKISGRTYYKKKDLINFIKKRIDSYNTDFKRYYLGRYVGKLVSYHGKEEEWLNEILREKGYII